MGQRDPGMLRVPDDRWQSADREGREERIEAGLLEFPAQSRDEGENEPDGDELESIRVFTKESKADKQTRHRPEPGKIRTALQGQPERAHGRRPEKDRERIDRHEDIAEVEKRDRVEREHRPKSGGRVEEAA